MPRSSPPGRSRVPGKSYERVSILGTTLWNVSMAEALDILDDFVAAGTPHTVVTANVDHLMLLEKNAAFREAYIRADLVTCDSIPLKWACRFLGTPLKDRVAGADLFFTIAERAAAKGHRLFYLGAAAGVAEKARAAMEKRFPGIKIVGCYSPPVMPVEELVRDAETLHRVREARPDILLAAFGAPKQELWLEAMRETLRIPVGIGVGAAFDFASGTVKRAPVWIQAVGLEWLWRLAHEPRRLWRRYLLMDTRFLFRIIKEKFKRRPANDAPEK